MEAATRAFHDPAWRDLTPAARARLLWRMAELIDAHADEIARLETSDQGQPYGIAANVSIPFAAEVFRYYAGWCTKIEGSTAPVSVPSSLFYTRREPLGVCALITPWNFPFMIGAWKLAPALATGNTVILKPAEQTPLTTLWLGRIAEEAGVPPGVVNVLTGGPEAGKALVAHDGVAQGVVHRIHRGGQGDRRRLGGQPEAGQPRAGRQGAEHHRPGRRPGEGRARQPPGRAAQQRPGLQGLHPVLRPPQRGRRVRRAARRRGVDAAARPGHRRGDRPRAARLGRAPRAGRAATCRSGCPRARGSSVAASGPPISGAASSSSRPSSPTSRTA